MLYKTNNNLVAINKDELIPTIRTNTRNNHDLNFQVPYAKKNVYKHSFFPHTLKDWNALPSDIVHAPSLNCFKAKLTNTCIANYFFFSHTFVTLGWRSCPLEGFLPT